MVLIRNGILLSHEKEHISVSSNKVDEPKEQTQNLAETKEKKCSSTRPYIVRGDD